MPRDEARSEREPLLFKFTEFGTYNQIFIVTTSEEMAWKEANKRGDYRTMQWLGKAIVALKGDRNVT